MDFTNHSTVVSPHTQLAGHNHILNRIMVAVIHLMVSMNNKISTQQVASFSGRLTSIVYSNREQYSREHAPTHGGNPQHGQFLSQQQPQVLVYTSFILITFFSILARTMVPCYLTLNISNLLVLILQIVL